MVKTALLLVVVLAGGSMRTVACESVCRDIREQQSSACHEHFGGGDTTTAASGQHACEHDVGAAVITAPKIAPSVQLRITVVLSAVRFPAAPLRVGIEQRFLARPPGNRAHAPSGRSTILRI